MIWEQMPFSSSVIPACGSANAPICAATACMLSARISGQSTFLWASSRPNEWSRWTHSAVNWFIVCASFALSIHSPLMACCSHDRAPKKALVRQLRDYWHQVCHSVGLLTRIVPHQLRHTYATEMLRAGVSFPAVMKLLGHNSPDMTMHYLDIAVPDLQREFHRAQAQPRHLVPQPKTSGLCLRDGIDGVIQSILASQHLLEMFRRSRSDDATRRQLERASNRLTKLTTVLRRLDPQK